MNRTAVDAEMNFRDIPPHLLVIYTQAISIIIIILSVYKLIRLLDQGLGLFARPVGFEPTTFGSGVCFRIVDAVIRYCPLQFLSDSALFYGFTR